MADSITLTGAVGVKTVYSVLGLNRYRGKYDLGHACTNAHGLTNMWARYKPVRLPDGEDTPAAVTDAQRAAVNFGLACSPAEALLGLALNATNARTLAAARWTYAAPVAGQHWLRLSDWRGYEHRAVSPMTPPGDLTLEFNATELTVGLHNFQLQSPLNLAAEDFPYTRGKYLCAIVYRETTAGAWRIKTVKTASATLDAGGREVTFAAAEVNNLARATDETATLRYFLCLASAAQTAAGAPGANTIFPLVCNDSCTGTITVAADSPFSITITGVSADGGTHPMLVGRFQFAEDGAAATAFGVASGLWLHGTIANTSTAAATIRRATMRLATSWNLALSSGTSVAAVPAAVRHNLSGSWAAISETQGLTLAAGASCGIIIDASTLPYLLASGVTGAAVRPSAFLTATLRHITTTDDRAAHLGAASLNVWDGTGALDIATGTLATT